MKIRLSTLIGKGEEIIEDERSKLSELSGKRASKRMDLLSDLIPFFTDGYQKFYAGFNFATLLYGFLNSFKKGSLKESRLACEVIGLLAISTGRGKNAKELYRESTSIFSQALQKKCEPEKITSILDSLAIVTLICGHSLETKSLETEPFMEVIWDIIRAPEKGSKSASVQASAISSWTMLLAVAGNWLLKAEYWNRAVNGLLNMLESDNVSIALAATEALGVMYEIGYLEKFLSITKDFEDEFSTIDELKETIIDRVHKILSKPEVEKLRNKQAAQCCLKLFEEDCFPGTALTIGESSIKIDKLSKFLQIKFVKRLLGSGFATHMLGNDLLHGALKLTVQTKKEKKLYIRERETVVVRCYIPGVKRLRPDCRLIDGKLSMALSSMYRKGTTQLLNKHRSLKDTEISTLCEALDV